MKGWDHQGFWNPYRKQTEMEAPETLSSLPGSTKRRIRASGIKK